MARFTSASQNPFERDLLPPSHFSSNINGNNLKSNNTNNNNKTTFTGATINRKRKTTTIARGEDLKLPLHVPKKPLSHINWKNLEEMLLPATAAALKVARAAKEDFGDVIFAADAPCSKDFPPADAELCVAAGICRFVSAAEEKQTPTRGYVNVKTVVEEKTKIVDNKQQLIKRRRMVAHPKDQNEFAKKVLKYTPNPFLLDLPHTSAVIPEVQHQGCLSGDGASAFYQLPLKTTTRCYYRFRDSSGRLMEMCRYLMGSTSSCEVCEAVTLAGFGHPKYVKPQYAVDSSLSNGRVWIDGAALFGPKSLLLKSKPRINKNLNFINFKLKDDLLEYSELHEFIGVEFDHRRKRVRPAFKTRNHLQQQLEIEPTAARLEQHIGRLVFCAGATRTPLVKYYFAMKSCRRYLNKLNAGLISPETICPLSRSTWSKLELWRKQSLQWHEVKRITGASSRADLFVDASKFGWGAVLLEDNGRVTVLGARWTADELPAPGERLNISKLELRGVARAVQQLKERLLQFRQVTIHVDNTSTMHNIRRGTCRSSAMALELLQLVDNLDQSVQWRITYVSSENNPADVPSRNAKFMTRTQFEFDDWHKQSLTEDESSLRSQYVSLAKQASLAGSLNMRSGWARRLALSG